MNACASSSERPKRPWWGVVVSVGVVAGWWLMDLQVHWRALPEFQHGWLVPVLAGYLAWERWGRMAALATTGWWLGPVLVALASAPWLLVAELYKRAVANTPTASFCLSVGCCGFIVALLWLQCGWRIARGLLFPLLFVFVAVPMPVVVWGPLVQGLQSLIAGLNVETLNLLGIPAERTGNILRLPTGQVGVDEACSGVRSLQSSIMAALFIADLVLGRIGPRILFLVAGVMLAIVGNFGRSLYLALTASRRGVDAVAGVHDAAGWSVFVFTSTATGLLAWWLVRAEARARRLTGGTH